MTQLKLKNHVNNKKTSGKVNKNRNSTATQTNKLNKQTNKSPGQNWDKNKRQIEELYRKKQSKISKQRTRHVRYMHNNNNHSFIHWLYQSTTSVSKIIEDIPTLDITELSKDIYEEYEIGCEESNTQPRCKLEHLSTHSNT